jgi:hypothetical protein
VSTEPQLPRRQTSITLQLGLIVLFAIALAILAFAAASVVSLG